MVLRFFVRCLIPLLISITEVVRLTAKKALKSLGPNEAVPNVDLSKGT
jgi:hypothetical protein